MESGRQQQPDKKQLLQQQQLQLQKQLHQQQQQQKLLKQQQQQQQFLQQQSQQQQHLQQQQQLSQTQNQQQQQLLQQTQSQSQQQHQHLLQQTQPQSQPQTQQQQQQMLQQTQPQIQRKQNLLTQQILQQEHLKQQQLLLERQQKQEQALLELLQLQDDNGEEDIQEELLIAQQRPQLIQQQQQLHLKQQHRQQQEQQQELQALQQKHAQSQLMHQLQHVQQLQQQQQQPQLIQQTQQLKTQDLQQSHSVQKSQILQPQLVEQSHFVQQPHQQQQTQYTSMSTQQQTIKQPPHTQQLLQQQLQQILSTNKNYPQRIVVLGNQPQQSQQQQLVTHQQQLVTLPQQSVTQQQQQSVIQQQQSVTQQQQVMAQQPQHIITNNTTGQQQLLSQQMQCVVVTGNTQQQPQQIQRVVVTSAGQQQQQQQQQQHQMQRIVVTSTNQQQQQQMQRVLVGTSGQQQQQQQQLLQQQLQQIQDVVESGTSSQQQSQQVQGVVVSTIGQQQQQQIQHLVVPSTNSQQQTQQIQRVIVSTAGQQLQQVQHVVVPGTIGQQQSHQMQRVIVSTAGQQQQQQVQQIQHIVIPSTNSQQHSQQMQCVVVTSASNQQQQQLAQQIQPSTQRIMIGQLKPSQQTQQSSSRCDVVLSQLHQQDIQRPIAVKQQQQRVVITGQQQLLKLPQQQQQSPHQIVLQPQLAQQILQPKQQQQQQQQQQRLVATHEKQFVQQVQQNQVVKQLQQQQKCVVITSQNQQNITVSSDESLLKELQIKQSHQQLHVQTSQNNLNQHQIDTQPQQQEQQQKQQKKQDKQQEQQKKKREQQMEQHDRSGVVIGQLQRPIRSEPEEIQQQLKLQQLQRQKLQECLLKELQKQQQQKQQQQQKRVNEQQLQKKRHQQQLREQVLLQQHLKQQQQKQQIEQQLLPRQKASQDNRISIIIDDNQEQVLHGNKEKVNHCEKSLVPEVSYSITEAVAMQLFRIVNKDDTDSSREIDEEKLVVLSTSSDEDEDDEVIRKQRNLFLEAERLVHERYDALSVALGPKYSDYYRKILMSWLDGQLPQEKFEIEVQKVMCSTWTSAKTARGCSSNSENKTVVVTDSPVTVTSNTYIGSTQDLLVASIPKTAGVKPAPKKLSASTLKETRSKIKAMAHVASSSNKETEEKKETADNTKINKTNVTENNLPLHNAFMASLAAWMPLSSQQIKRRLARARGVTETGCPLRLYTYSDVPQARGSSDHWYPDVPGSLANWYWPDQLSYSEPVKNEVEKPSTREKAKNKSANAMATAVLLRPPSRTMLPLLLRTAADTEAARAAQHKQWLERHLVNHDMDMMKKLQWERLEEKKKLIAMVQLRDVHKKLLGELKVRSRELDSEESRITEWLRRLQTRILERRRQVLLLFRIQKEDLRVRMRKYFDRSWQERPEDQVRRKLLLESAETINDDDSDDEMENDEDHQNLVLRQNLERVQQLKENQGQYQHQFKTKSTFSIPRQTGRGRRLKFASLTIKLLRDRQRYHEKRRMLQAIRLEQLRVSKHADRVRKLRHMHCPCGESNGRPCRYRKQMRRFRKQLRTNELIAIEKKTEIEIVNEAEKEMVVTEESKKPETVVVENKKGKAKKKKIVTTKVKNAKKVKKQDTMKTECNESGSDTNKKITDGDTTTTTILTTKIKHKSISNATKTNATCSSVASTNTNTTENAAPRILDFIDLVEADEKQDMGTDCELFRDKSPSSTRSYVTDATRRRQQSSRQRDQKCTVNVVAVATRAAQAALAASRRTQKRRNEAAAAAVASVSAPIDLTTEDDDNRRRASELMPPPPPPRNVSPRKPSVGARYLKQQQLLLDRHKQLERMRREEEERQHRTRNELQEEQNNEPLTEFENVAAASPSQLPSLQPTRLRRRDGSPETTIQDLDIEFRNEKYDEFSNLSRGIGGKKEGRQQNNYHFYYGDADYYSSDDEMTELSSNEPPFPPLMHDLRMDQFPQSSIRVPDVTRTTSVVKTRPPSTPSSSVDFKVGEFEHDQKNVLPVNKRKREINEPVYRELCDKELELIELPGLRQEGEHQFKNGDKSVTGDNQRMEKLDSFQQHQKRTSRERQFVKKIASVELQSAERKRRQIAKKSSEVEEIPDREQSGTEPNSEHKQTQMNENKIKQVTKRKSHSRRQSKPASNRKQRQRKRRNETEIILEEKSEHLKNKESETTVGIEQLRLVKCNNKCPMEEDQQVENETKRLVKSSRVVTNHSQFSQDLENNKQLLTDHYEQLVSDIDAGKDNSIILQNLVNKYLKLVVGLPPEHYLQQLVYLKQLMIPLKNDISIQPESIADMEIGILKHVLSLPTSQVDHEETRTTLEELRNLLLQIRQQRIKMQQNFKISDIDDKYSGGVSTEGVHSLACTVYEDIKFWFGSSSSNNESNDDNKQRMSKINKMIRQYLISSRGQKSVCTTRDEMQQLGRKGQKQFEQDETEDCQPCQGKRMKLSLLERQCIMEPKVVEECDRPPYQEILQLNQRKRLQLSRIERISELRQQEQQLKREMVQIDLQKQREQDRKKRLLEQPHASKCVWALGKFTSSPKQYYSELFPLREQLMRKIVENKNAGRLLDCELQQFTDDVTAVIKKKSLKSLAHGQASKLGLSSSNIKRGSALWWIKIGLLRRISPLVMKVNEKSDEQSTLATAVRITDQLQLTRPQVRKIGVTVVPKDRKQITPTPSRIDEKKELRKFLHPHLLRMMTGTEETWLKQLQVKLEELSKKKDLHWNTMMEKQRQQVKLLLLYYRHRQHNEYREQKQLEVHTPLLVSPVHNQEVAVGQARKAHRDTPVIQDLQPHSLAISQERKQHTSPMLIGDDQFNHETMLVVADPTWKVSKRWKELEVMRKAHEARWKCRLRQWFKVNWMNRMFGKELYDRLVRSQNLDVRIQQKTKAIAALKQLPCRPLKLQPDLPEKRNVVCTAKVHDERMVFDDHGRPQRQDVQMSRLKRTRKNYGGSRISAMMSKPSVMENLKRLPNQMLDLQSQNQLQLQRSVVPKASTIVGAIGEEQWKQEEQNKSIKWIFRKLTYLLQNQRIVLQRQMDRINEQYSCELNIEPSVSLTSVRQPSTYLTAQRPSTSKQQLSTSPVLLTPRLPEQQSERPLVTASNQLAIQLRQEKRQFVEQRLSGVFSQLKPLMELWHCSLRFPARWLHQQLDEIEEIKKREESKRSGRQREQRKRQYDGTLVPTTADASTTELAWQQLKRIYEYLEWRQQRVRELVNEYASAMRREHTASLKTVVSRTEERPPSTYSVLLKLQQPSSSSSGQRLTYSVLLKLKRPLTSESPPQPLLRYSTSLKLQQTANVTTPSKYSALLILQQPTTSTQVSSSHSMLSVPQQLLTTNQQLSVLLTPQKSSIFQNSKFANTPVIIHLSEHQSSVSPVILTPQQQPSTVDDQRPTSSVIRRALQTQVPSITTASPPVTFVSEPNKELRRQLNDNRQFTVKDKKRLSEEKGENGDRSENVNSTTTKRSGSPGSEPICSKRLRSIVHSQTDKSASDFVVHDENTIIILDSDDECEKMNDPDRVDNTSSDSSDSSSESSVSDDSTRRPVTSMSVQMSDKSPLTIKFIKTKPVISAVKPPESTTDPVKQDAVVVKTKETQKKKCKDATKKNKKNHDDVEKIQTDKTSSAAVRAEIVNGPPADVTGFFGKPTVGRSPGALTVGREPIKVSIIKCAPPVEVSVVGDDPVRTAPEAKKPGKLMMTVMINIPTEAADVDRITAIVSKLTEAAVAAARKTPVVVRKTAEVPESGPPPPPSLPPVAPPPPARMVASVEKPTAAKRTVRRRNNRIGTKRSSVVTTNQRRHRGRLLKSKRETSVRRRRRHLLRTVTVDTRGPAVPSFRDHGFADGTIERVVHERFVTTIMAMTAAQSIASYVPPRRSRNPFDPAVVREVCEEYSKTGAAGNDDNAPKPGDKVDASTNTPVPLSSVMDRLEKMAECGPTNAVCCGDVHLRSGCARTDSVPLVAAARFAKALRATDTASSSSSTPSARSSRRIVASRKAAVAPVKRSVSAAAGRGGVRLTETGKRSASATFAVTPSLLPPAPRNGSEPASRPSGNAVAVKGSSKRSGSVAPKTIVEEETRTVTITRTTCPTVRSPMDVTADACKLVASTCEKFVRAMVTERLKKAGRGAGTFQMRRREEYAAAVAVDEDVRPTPEYCWTATIAPTKTAAAPIVTEDDKNVISLLPSAQQQQQQQRPACVTEIVCGNKPNESIVKTVRTTVETRTFTTTSSPSTVHDVRRPSSIVAAATTAVGTSARTRGVVWKKTGEKPAVSSPPPPPPQGTAARTRPVTASERPPGAPARRRRGGDVPAAATAEASSSCETPRPVLSLPATAGRRGFFVERGRPLLRPEFHRRRPFGTLVATCAMAAAEATAVNDAAYAYFDEEEEEEDPPGQPQSSAAEDDDTDDWDCYFGDPEMLPPVSRFNDFLANDRRGPRPSETTSTQRPPADDDNGALLAARRRRQRLLDEIVRQQDARKRLEREAEQRIQNQQRNRTPDEYYREFLRLQNAAETPAESNDGGRRSLVSW